MSSDIGADLIRSDQFKPVLAAHRDIVTVAARQAETAMSMATTTDVPGYCRDNLSKAREVLALALRSVTSLQQALETHTESHG